MPPQNTTRAFLGNTPTRSFFRIAAFLLVQSIVCVLVTLLLGWAQIELDPKLKFNEFRGMVLVVALYIMAPVACALSLPLQIYIYSRNPMVRSYWLGALASCAVSIAWEVVFHLTIGRGTRGA